MVIYQHAHINQYCLVESGRNRVVLFVFDIDVEQNSAAQQVLVAHTRAVA